MMLSASFGHDLSTVRIHTDDDADRLARQLDADAVATPGNLSFAAGRYRPDTVTGQRLLKHEAVHLRDMDQAASLTEGVAPVHAARERHAAAAASYPEGGLAAFPTKPAAETSGPVYRIHRAPRTVQQGVNVFEPRTATSPIEVRIDLVEMEPETAPGTIEAMLTIEYAGTDVSDSTHWIQFVWMEGSMVGLDTDPAGRPLKGAFPSTAGDVEFTTDRSAPKWKLDARAGFSIPWAERSTTSHASVSVLDNPLVDVYPKIGLSWLAQMPDAESITLVAHFDTYLLQDRRFTYHVEWFARTTFFRVPSGGQQNGAVTYGSEPPQSISGLPPALRAAADRHSLLKAYLEGT